MSNVSDTLNDCRTTDNPRISQYHLRGCKRVPCIEACVWSGCGWVCPVSDTLYRGMCQTPCIEACVWSGCGWVCPVSAAAPPRCREKVGAMPGPRPPAFIEQFYLSIKIFLFLPSLHKNICCQDAEAGPEHPLAGPGRKASVRTPTTPPATTPVKIFAHE